MVEPRQQQNQDNLLNPLIQAANALRKNVTIEIKGSLYSFPNVIMNRFIMGKKYEKSLYLVTDSLNYSNLVIKIVRKSLTLPFIEAQWKICY